MRRCKRIIGGKEERGMKKGEGKEKVKEEWVKTL
jgi:hypothetical protein